MIDNIKQGTFYILGQLNEAVSGLSVEKYTSKLDILSGSTVGMHVRHILEFYQCVLFGVAKEENVDYDKRLRNIVIETDPVFAVEIIEAITFALNAMDDDKPLNVVFTPGLSDEALITSSSLSRELCYLIEHTIHHMAIIKMAYFQNFTDCTLPENFGVAFSTIKHNNNVHSHLLTIK